MLMMSRRAGEVIQIGEDIEIVISKIGRSRVTVGISAPRRTPVAAREVKLVEAENRTAASIGSAADLSGLIAHLRPVSSSSGSRRRVK
jgi:carbon storage regulator